ncbi:hypothetical protein D9613_010698 [Agrocybe pediades]|uniref:Uncharacterized protein n=1 Tax=Agrocybe pediades TaxID=84607 RepID=A0A8H4QLL3_9AGAR|nr:hypothetical protein D9613_010698 [Agrocybe pediades]
MARGRNRNHHNHPTPAPIPNAPTTVNNAAVRRTSPTVFLITDTTNTEAEVHLAYTFSAAEISLCISMDALLRSNPPPDPNSLYWPYGYNFLARAYNAHVTGNGARFAYIHPEGQHLVTEGRPMSRQLWQITPQQTGLAPPPQHGITGDPDSMAAVNDILIENAARIKRQKERVKEEVAARKMRQAFNQETVSFARNHHTHSHHRRNQTHAGSSSTSFAGPSNHAMSLAAISIASTPSADGSSHSSDTHNPVVGPNGVTTTDADLHQLFGFTTTTQTTTQPDGEEEPLDFGDLPMNETEPTN